MGVSQSPSITSPARQLHRELYYYQSSHQKLIVPADKTTPPTSNSFESAHSLQINFFPKHQLNLSQYITMPKAAAPRKAKSDSAAKGPAKKAKKDPNAPKRGLSAYMFFANEQREVLKKEQPDLKFGEVGKVLGERWKALTDSQKAPYNKKAEADKKRYEAEKESYAGGAAADEEEEE